MGIDDRGEKRGHSSHPEHFTVVCKYRLSQTNATHPFTQITPKLQFHHWHLNSQISTAQKSDRRCSNVIFTAVLKKILIIQGSPTVALRCFRRFLVFAFSNALEIDHPAELTGRFLICSEDEDKYNHGVVV